MNMRKDRRMQMIRTKYIHKQIVMLEKKKKKETDLRFNSISIIFIKITYIHLHKYSNIQTRTPSILPSTLYHFIVQENFFQIYKNEHPSSARILRKRQIHISTR